MAILKYNSGDMLHYTLTRRKGMKTLRLKIKSDGSVHVSASPSVSLTVIEGFLLEKISWILENTEKIKSTVGVTPELSDNALLSVFGEALRLRIAASLTEYVKREQGTLEIGLPDRENTAAAERLVIGEIVNIANDKLESIYHEYLEKAAWRDEPPRLKIKLLKSKWGHCSLKNREIMINIAVCGLPMELIRYLVVHEVTHLFVHNHRSEFYSFGERLLPGFKKYDRQLNAYRTDLWSNILLNH